MTSESDRILRLLHAGLDISGSSAAGAVSVAMGLLFAGPVGGAVGGAMGAALSLAWTKLGSEITERLLSSREQARVGYVFGQAAVEIRERIDRGESLRSDGFFSAQQTGRSDAAEVAESILLKSQREPEENKLPYMAHLLASIAFTPQVSPAMAHQITKAAEQLSYRQFCMLKLTAVTDHFRLRSTHYREYGSFPKPMLSILYEFHELVQREFIGIEDVRGFGITDMIPANARVQGLGRDMFTLMQLSEIPEGHVESIATALR